MVSLTPRETLQEMRLHATTVMISVAIRNMSFGTNILIEKEVSGLIYIMDDSESTDEVNVNVVK